MCPFAVKADRAAIERTLSEEPTVDTVTLAERFGISETTARRYRHRWERNEKTRKKAERATANGEPGKPAGADPENGDEPPEPDEDDDEDEPDGDKDPHEKRRPKGPAPPLVEVTSRISGPDLGAQAALRVVAEDVRSRLTVEAHERTAEVLQVGKRVVEWYYDRGLSSEFASCDEAVNAWFQFWFANRDRINEQDDVVHELRGIVENMARLLDPIARRKQFHDEVYRMVLVAAMAGHPLPQETVVLLFRDADALAVDAPTSESAITVPTGQPA